MKIRKHLTGLAIFLAVFGITSLAIADDHWSDDWRIEVDGRAKSAGTMSFTLTFATCRSRQRPRTMTSLK